MYKLKYQRKSISKNTKYVRIKNTVTSIHNMQNKLITRSAKNKHAMILYSAGTEVCDERYK
jgi:hypothetical protein